MSPRGLYQGYGLQGVDDKGRVAIPAALRQTVEGNNPRTAAGDMLRTLSVALSETQQCLIAYDQAYPEMLAAELDRRANAIVTPGAPVELDPHRIGMGIVDTVAFDQSGRFVLQGYPRKFARIDKLAMFLAVGPYFEIWNPQLLLEARGDNIRLRGLVEHLLEEKGASA